MNCYRHSNTSAIGLCKTCFKAVCFDCSTDVGNGLACKDSCEEKVIELNEMFDRSAKIYGVGKHKSRIPASGVLIWLLLCIAFWAIFVLGYIRTKEVDFSTLIMALVFTGGLGIAYFSARRTGLKS